MKGLNGVTGIHIKKTAQQDWRACNHKVIATNPILLYSGSGSNLHYLLEIYLSTETKLNCPFRKTIQIQIIPCLLRKSFPTIFLIPPHLFT